MITQVLNSTNVLSRLYADNLVLQMKRKCIPEFKNNGPFQLMFF